MFCPKCKSVYIDGLLRCEDCDSSLVETLPAEEIEPDDKLVPLIQTTDIGLLAVVKSLLEASGIPYFVQGEEGLHVLPLGNGGFFNPSAYGAIVMVQRQDLDDARQLLEQVDNDSEAEDKEPGDPQS